MLLPFKKTWGGRFSKYSSWSAKDTPLPKVTCYSITHLTQLLLYPGFLPFTVYYTVTLLPADNLASSWWTCCRPIVLLPCQLSAASYQLSAISCQLSAVSYQLSQLSTISYQLSAFSYNCQLSAFSYQLSAISCQQSAVSYQLSAISCQLSAVSYQLSAILPYSFFITFLHFLSVILNLYILPHVSPGLWHTHSRTGLSRPLVLPALSFILNFFVT